jgi:hypothetical protein
VTFNSSAEPLLSFVHGDRHGAANCRWATPTLMLAAPLWFDAENSPWSCVRDAAPRTLITTDACEMCPRWEPRYSATPLMLDWFGVLSPHETE